MAAANYDEVTYSAGHVITDWSSIDPLYKWDPHFPERLSRLSVTPDYSERSGSGSAPQRRQKRGRNRNTSRFKTQPITFDEIKEVDEEPRNSSAEDPKDGLKNQFAAFSRSMDGLVPGFPVLPSHYARKSRMASDSESGVGSSSSAAGGSGRGQRGDEGAHSRPPMAPAATPRFSPPANGTDVTGEPEAAAAASGSDHTTQTAEAAALFAAVEKNPTLAQVQDISRARRKKRRSRKSIEEEPELETIAAVDSHNSAG